MRYVPLRPADENQKKALARMRGQEAFALLMAMRMRKSKVVVDDFGEMELAGRVRDLFIIAPGGAYRTWTEVLDDDLSKDLRGRIMVHVWQSGSGKGVQRDREAFLAAQDRPRALLMNIEALSRPGDARDLSMAFLRQNRGSVVVIDESTRIKNKSKRTDFILKRIRPLANYRRILSGLPTPRSPLDAFFQFEFLDWNILGFRSWYAFRNHVAIMKLAWFGGRTVHLIDKESGVHGFRPEAFDEIKKLIAPHSYRVEFRPRVPTTYSIREVEMTPEQIKAYSEMREFATTMLENESHVVATVVIAQVMRLHQILCGHVIDENDMEHSIPENKTRSLMEILDDYAGKAVIWCSYDHDVRKVMAAIAEEYGPESVAGFWGGNVRTREADEKRFKTDPRCRFMLATPDSGGMGRTWDVADLAVYYSSRDNLEHRDQSEQRTMGKDKARGVDVVDLVCPDTVEWRRDGGPSILMALRKKIDMAIAINGDNWRQWVV